MKEENEIQQIKVKENMQQQFEQSHAREILILQRYAYYDWNLLILTWYKI
jgi:hypothetical protein